MAQSNGLTVYAAAIEQWSKRRRMWVPDIEYVQAEDAGHARAQVTAAHPNRRTCRIVAIAPVVGWFADKEDGSELFADDGQRVST